jgi:mono/diheme cytochrome c family protein
MLAALVVLAMGGAIAGAGVGDAPAEREAAPAQAEVQAAKQRIAAGGAITARGRQLFADEGCDRCHSIAAIGAGGKLGPRLDRLDEDAKDIAESIADPRDETVDGYPEKLMPTDYARRMDDEEIQALAAFVAAASGDKADDGGRGRDRRAPGRGRERNRGPGRRGPGRGGHD